MEQVGTLLWQMRTAAGLSQSALAQRAGISKSALSRWESSERQPRVAELEAVLNALGAGAAQRASAYACIEAPRALRRLRSADVTARLCAPPALCDLLLTMRRRRGFSQEQLAAQVGVGQPAVARWERGDRLPSSEQMQSLCYALGARDDELIVLTRGRFTESPTTEPVGREEKQACLLKSLMWHHYNRPEMDGGGSELEYLILERKAWKLATQDDSARPMLARILAYHADSMRNQERWLEAASLASRALALIPRPDRELDVALRAGAVSAAAAVYRGSAVAPERGVKLLQPWLARTNPPDYRAWIMSDMAEYMAMGGYIDEARALAEAHIQVGNRPEASKWLENAREVIDTFDHERLRPRAAMLARRL